MWQNRNTNLFRVFQHTQFRQAYSKLIRCINECEPLKKEQE
jgi:hypothetical protein